MYVTCCFLLYWPVVRSVVTWKKLDLDQILSMGLYVLVMSRGRVRVNPHSTVD